MQLLSHQFEIGYKDSKAAKEDSDAFFKSKLSTISLAVI
jgi:hypothetical protein